jgi:hypothetical protein
MDEQKPISIASDTYAFWGEKIVGLHEPIDKSPEAREAERRADRIGYAALLKALRWDEAQYTAAQAFDFPKSVTRRMLARFSSEPVFSKRAIEAWRQRVFALTDSLR